VLSYSKEKGRSLGYPYTTQDELCEGSPGQQDTPVRGGKKNVFPVKFYLAVDKDIQIGPTRSRRPGFGNKYLEKNLGENGFFLKIMVYPHHILRRTPCNRRRSRPFLRRNEEKHWQPIGQTARVKGGKHHDDRGPRELQDDSQEALRRRPRSSSECRLVDNFLIAATRKYYQ
jgi:ribosomal protein L16/L10AE